MRLAEIPRYPLGVWPTPLQSATRLSDSLGVPVLIKRDDLSGLGLGGNKVRKLEYLVADALGYGSDVLVTGGGRHSNHAALTALAAARAGIAAHLVFYGGPAAGEPEGNDVVNALTGVDITYTGDPDRASVEPALHDVARQLKNAGRRPYVIPRGGATALGCVGYVAASLELTSQLFRLGVSPGHVFVATGSCGTQAGLVLGAHWLRSSYRVVGVTVSRPRNECLDRIQNLTSECAKLLGLEIPSGSEIEVLDDYIGPGYGKPSSEGLAALELVARTEGLILDPVFTAKAMVAVRAFARRSSSRPVVFWHTGGAVNTFAPHLMSSATAG